MTLKQTIYKAILSAAYISPSDAKDLMMVIDKAVRDYVSESVEANLQSSRALANMLSDQLIITNEFRTALEDVMRGRSSNIDEYYIVSKCAIDTAKEVLEKYRHPTLEELEESDE